jgi:hypothetical protein
VQEERKAKQDRFRQQKAEEDAARREEEIVRLRDEAKAPAFAAEIEDCGVLINWFNGKYGNGKVPETHGGGLSEKAVLDGVSAPDGRRKDVTEPPLPIPPHPGQEARDP